MAKVKIQGNASGTGVLTVTAPNTSTDRTITLPDSTGTLATTADTGVAGITSSADATAITIDSSEKVNIGETGTPYPSNSRFHVKELTGGNYVASFRHDGNSDDSMGIAIVTGKNTGSSGVVAAQFKDGDGNDVGKIYHTGTGLFYNTGATGGIEFTNGGAANTLDDYEEGIHVVTATDSGGGATYGLNSGYDTFAYTKIGRLVTITGTLVNSTVTGTPSGTIALSLPFTAVNTTDQAGKSGGAGISYYQVQKYTSGVYPAHSIAEGDNVVILKYGVVDANQYDTYFNTSSQLYCNFSYFTA